MGRPINKRNFGDTSGGGQQISVTADTGGGSGAGFIVKQKGSKRFLVDRSGTEGICKLVTSAPASGEMRITLADSAAGTYYASKIQEELVLLKQVQAHSQLVTKWLEH